MARVSDPNSNDEGGDELLKGPSMGADGRLERFSRMEEPVKLPTTPGLRPAEEPPLELEKVAPKKFEPRIEVFRELPPSREVRRRSTALKAVVALLVLGVGLGAAFLVFRPRVSELPFGVSESGLLQQLNSGDPVPLIISSEPAGAQVVIDGVKVGETPWAGENKWEKTTRITVTLPGYKRWEGQLTPHQPLTLDLQLKK